MRATLLRADVEEEVVFTGDQIAHAVTIVGHRSKTATGSDPLRMVVQIQEASLVDWGLRRGQTPRLTEDLFQERRVNFEILRDNIETEQVAIDAFAAHSVLVAPGTRDDILRKAILENELRMDIACSGNS